MISLNNVTITELSDIFTVSSTHNTLSKMINRPNYGISFCINGKIIYKHKNKKIISDKNHVVILPKGESYSISRSIPGLFPLINFDCLDFLCDEIISIPVENMELYISFYKKMKRLSIFDNKRQKVMSILYDILDHLSVECSPRSIITPAIAYIQSNFHNPLLSITELANICHISESHFRRVFYEQLKISPKQFIIDTRMLKAKDLLSEGDLKIQAVCEKCGFTNQYHFCRLFKEKTGQTPTQYREKNIIRKL